MPHFERSNAYTWKVSVFGTGHTPRPSIDADTDSESIQLSKNYKVMRSRTKTYSLPQALSLSEAPKACPPWMKTWRLLRRLVPK